MDERAGSPADPYQAIAELYDQEHDPFHDDVDLLLQFAEVSGGPIIEMGCGSGRVVAPFAEAGFSVVGIDRSSTMLDRARKRLTPLGFGDNVSLVEGDMESDAPVPGGPFGLVAFTLNALMHLPTPDLQATALANARHRLAPGGLLVLDIVNPAPEYLVSLAAAPTLEWSGHQADGSVVDKWSFRQVHAVDQVIATTLWYDRVSVDGTLTRLRSAFDLRYLHPHELELMLTVAGFRDIQMYGGYELEPLDDSSDRLIVTAEPIPASTDKSTGA